MSIRHAVVMGYRKARLITGVAFQEHPDIVKKCDVVRNKNA